MCQFNPGTQKQRSTLQVQEHAQFPSSRSHFWGPCNDRVLLGWTQMTLKSNTSYKERLPPPYSAASRRSLPTWPLKQFSFWFEISAVKLNSHPKLISWPISSEEVRRVKNISKMKLHYQKGVKKTINFFSSSSGNEWKLRSIWYII